MPFRTDIIYRYDGTFDGFLTCVYQSYARKELPSAILGPEDAQLSLLETRDIETDAYLAGRVYKSIPARISQDALDLIQKTMLTCLEHKERRALDFLRLGYRVGPGIMDMHFDESVSIITGAVLHMEREAHLYLGFIRFTENAGVLSSIIEPKNRVLTLIAQHFLDRYSNESFIIFDRTNREALVAQAGQGRIVPLESLELPEPDDQERAVRALFRRFHATVSIGARKNPRCQMTHMPLRYRRVMTEFFADPIKSENLPSPEEKRLLTKRPQKTSPAVSQHAHTK